MSISEPEKRSPPLSVPGQTVPAGLPEPDVLARMANEFFTALPDFIPVAESVLNEAQRGTSVPSAHLAGVPVNTAFVPTADIPSDTQLRALPTTSMFPAVHPQIPAIPGTAIPEVPGGVTETRYGGISSLSFLDEIRPIFSYPKGTPLPLTPQAATVTIPGATELQALVNSFSSYATPEVTESVPAQSAPQLPGTSFPRETTDFSTGYSFLNEIRQLAPAGTLAGADPSHTHTATAPGLNLSSQPFDVQAIRRDFPILQERVHGKPLIWLDNAATTQKPQSVIDRLSHFYQRENSNIHRAAHELAARATDAYESAREKVRRFINAPTVREIIFVRGATEGVNLVAQSWGRQHIQKDDEIVITWLEHHANIVPWQILCAEKGAKLRVVPVDNTGQVLLDEYQRLLGQKTRLVAFAQVSNALGTVTPAHEMIEMAHRYGAKVLLDGAQAVSHMQTDVQAFDCDFYVFSGHKMFAPTGIGVVYGKTDVLENSPPWQAGGNMIQDVTFEKTTYQPPPGRFEAGTGNIADAVGLGAAVDYLERVGMVNISRYEHDLLLYATESLQKIPGLRLIGTAKEKAGVLSFVLDGYRTEDVGAALNRQGIAVRAGHHCAQPILRRFGVESTVRPSLALYNTCEEIDALAAALWNLKLGHTSL
ncbi:MAG: family 2A encapsulin nanocompartment cargo protein cysteine desulfurase [Candidatus Acidiferrum sp.]